MRLLPISLLYALFASVALSESAEKPTGDSRTEIETVEDSDRLATFNGVRVPGLTEIEGEKFNATVKEGYWFVKHHS
jgi:protein disulfide-isomerase